MPISRRIKKILIVNRGEIAVRIMRTCRDLEIVSVAVYSDVDRGALHVQLADEAYPLGGVTAAESYLNQQRIMEIARQSAADAIHPGYGFLSENPAFAELVESEGLIFIGPSSTAMTLLGNKTEARKLARQQGVPTVSGSVEPFSDVQKGLALAEELGFPIILKAVAGGGGKGMRIVRAREDFIPAARTAQSEAKSAFGDERIYIEKYISNPRHIEIQILADQHGQTIYLGERECSIQRRHQKVIEETPSSVLTEELRQQMGEAAVKVMRAAGYSNAGTVEFLVDENQHFYFLEVNTRLQVEHPVTELVCGLDLVAEQIRLAEALPLQFSQKQVRRLGHALECRIYAEDPSNNFFPSTGTLYRYRPPQGPFVRVDNGFQQGDSVPIYYDPLLAKVITWGNNRAHSIATMRRALSEFVVEGVRTTIPFCEYVLRTEQFRSGSFNTNFVQNYFQPEYLYLADEWNLTAAAVSAAFVTERTMALTPQPSVVRSNNRWKELRRDHFRS